MPNSVHWMRNSAEHRAHFYQAYAIAKSMIPERIRGLERGTWAVALDADETVLDNSAYQKELVESGRSFTSESWNDWCRKQEARPLPGAARFLRFVHEAGGRIAIVTNRSDLVHDETEANFRAESLPFDVILTRSQASNGDKSVRWRQIEEGTATPGLPPLKIVMWVGDNIGDFPEGRQELRLGADEGFADFGSRFIIVPNPAYGSWERNARE
jgi:5'-nucleotidase (lipoprotein e(P4) family)